ncbi:MAG: ABC transporter permease [Treponema sp.]|jgi:peptide/nickel transport system permease protein|nr:ABC transporter permease [Treponema sp.]
MIRKNFTRLSMALFSIFGASILSFVLLRLAPGDPVGLVLGPFATEQAREHLTREMGLDKPILIQYGIYIRDLFKGNWGYSYSMSQEVRKLFFSRLPASLELSIFALLFTISFALILALFRTYTKCKILKHLVDGICYVCYSMPQFFLGLLLLIVFSGLFKIFPGPEGRTGFSFFVLPRITGFLVIDSLISGRMDLFIDALRHLILPACTLGLYSMAFLTRILQANLERTYHEQYVTISYSRGLTEWKALIRHALPNALVTSSTTAAVLIGIILTGTMLVETIFAWPGIGSLITSSIQKKDFSVVQAFIFFSSFIFVISNLIVEFLITKIDPRIGMEK